MMERVLVPLDMVERAKDNGVNVRVPGHLLSPLDNKWQLDARFTQCSEVDHGFWILERERGPSR